MKKLKPILCMTFGPMGDALMTMALFDDILRLAPEASFTVLTSSNAKMIRDLSAAYPSVRILEIPLRLSAMPKFLMTIFSRRWTLLMPGVARHQSLQLKLFFLALYIIPGNQTIGFGDIRKRFGWLPFHTILHYDLSISILNNYRRMVPPLLGVTVPKNQPVHVMINSRWPATFSLEKKQYIVVHMFGTRARLSFPPHRWKTLMAKIAQKYPTRSLVFTGGTKDETLIRDITKSIPHAQILINLPILDVAGVIKESALYIGMDTGVTHLAAVMSVPSVIIGNNSNPIWWANYNPNGVILVNNTRCVCTGDKTDQCRVVDPEDGEAYYRCTYDITDDAVFEAFHKYLK